MPIKMDKIKSRDNTNASYDARNWISHMLTECKMAKPLWKIIWQCILILKMDLPYDLAIKLRHTSPGNDSLFPCKNFVHRGFLQLTLQ